MQTGFTSLCDDILYLLGKSLIEENPDDAHTLMLLSKKTRVVIMPIVYSSVHLRGGPQCAQTLQFLHKNSWIASCVRKLVVDPCHNQRYTDEMPSGVTEDWIICTLEVLAPKLMHLAEFHWEGSCLPKSNTFWKTLQDECTELRYVGTSVSQQDPFSWDDTMSFLKFEDLRGLSIQIKSSPDNSSTTRYLSSLPPLFWDMIHPSRSPKLHRLSFETDILRSFNFNSLFALRLPSLNRLTIGSFVFSDSHTEDITAFLCSAHSLEHLQIAPVARIPWVDVNIPHIQHYGGNIYSILTGAAHWSSLISLDISCFPLSFERMMRFFRRTSRLPSLRTLKLRITSEYFHRTHTICDSMESADPSLGFFPALAFCYPNLQTLQMINSAGNHLVWRSILLSLKELPHLLIFHLTQAPSLVEDSVFQLAKAILAMNANLEKVTIQRTSNSWYNSCDCIIKEKATLRYVGHQPAEVASRYTKYGEDEPEVSQVRFFM